MVRERQRFNLEKKDGAGGPVLASRSVQIFNASIRIVVPGSPSHQPHIAACAFQVVPCVRIAEIVSPCVSREERHPECR